MLLLVASRRRALGRSEGRGRIVVDATLLDNWRCGVTICRAALAARPCRRLHGGVVSARSFRLVLLSETCSGFPTRDDSRTFKRCCCCENEVYFVQDLRERVWEV